MDVGDKAPRGFRVVANCNHFEVASAEAGILNLFNEGERGDGCLVKGDCDGGGEFVEHVSSRDAVLMTSH